VSQIGDILREARVHRGLSIRDVSDVTRIRTKYLEALEQDDFEVIPGSTFVKAYLRTYANLLRLDADAIVDEYRYMYERVDDDSIVRADRSSQQSRSQSMVGRSRQKTHRGRRGYFLIGALAVVVVVLLAVLTSRGGGGASLGPDSIGGLPSTTITSASGSGTTESADTTAPGEADGSTTTVSVAVATGKDVELTLTVTEGSCFLVVRDDNKEGTKLFAGTLSAGEIQTFSDSKRYWLQVGVPEVLTVNVNGVDHSLEGPAGYFVVTETAIESVQ
jgi:cytoskeletal protein RodZ